MKNPPAFPRPMTVDCERENSLYARPEQDGMTLRDYYAGQALAGMAANQVDPDLTIDANAKVAAHWAYTFADAMLAAREQGQ